MSRLRFRISMSLDGFIAGPDQSVDNDGNAPQVHETLSARGHQPRVWQLG